MAKFCSNCGTQIAEGKKFCSNCGTKAEETENLQQPSQQQSATQTPQPPQYSDPQQTQYYQQPPYAAMYAPVQKKKNLLPLILIIAGVLFAGIVALVIFLVIPALTGNSAKKDSPELAQNMINPKNGETTSENADGPIKGEDFKLSMDKPTYEPGEAIAISVSGNVSGQMIEEHAFIILMNAGESHGAVGFWYMDLEANVGQYLAYAPNAPGNYEARLYKNAASSESSFLASASFSVAGSPAVENEIAGLWRNVDDEGSVALYHYRSDGSFDLRVFYADGSEIVLTGRYRISGEDIYMSNRIYNGERLDGEVSQSFDVSGDFISISGEICQRVPDEYVDAVLADPKGPYPPGSDDFDWENFDWENFDWDSLFG